MAGAEVGAGDQKSASMGVCASMSANIGAAAIAVKAKTATQRMTITVARGLTSIVYRNEWRGEPMYNAGGYWLVVGGAGGRGL
jgi:hypothetical protein